MSWDEDFNLDNPWDEDVNLGIDPLHLIDGYDDDGGQNVATLHLTKWQNEDQEISLTLPQERAGFIELEQALSSSGVINGQAENIRREAYRLASKTSEPIHYNERQIGYSGDLFGVYTVNGSGIVSVYFDKRCWEYLLNHSNYVPPAASRRNSHITVSELVQKVLKCKPSRENLDKINSLLESILKDPEALIEYQTSKALKAKALVSRSEDHQLMCHPILASYIARRTGIKLPTSKIISLTPDLAPLELGYTPPDLEPEILDGTNFIKGEDVCRELGLHANRENIIAINSCIASLFNLKDTGKVKWGTKGGIIGFFISKQDINLITPDLF
jgi:hypothetical protein